MTMTLIATTTLGTAAATIEFTSIPQDGTDLLLVVSARTSTTATDANMQFNNSDGSFRRLLGNGSGAASDTSAGMIFFIGNSSQTASTFGNAEIYIPNYAGSTNKSVSLSSVSENNATTAYQGISAALWSNTAAITSIKLLASFIANSTVSLYKITKGSDGITTAS
jgi:hypothetical protein